MNVGTPMPEEKKPTGAIISIIVIVLVIAVGAYYFLRQVPIKEEVPSPTPSAPAVSVEESIDATTASLAAQGTSTDIADIQKDLNATDLSNVGTGLSNIAI